jgi:hypothetical protein
MPRGPQGEARPTDVIGCAVKVALISVGEDADDRYSAPGRTRSGHAGAAAQAQKLLPERQYEIAQRAANSRWN